MTLPAVLVALALGACAGTVSDTTTFTTASTTTEAPQTSVTTGTTQVTPMTTTTSSTTTTTTVPEADDDPIVIVIENGEVVGGPQKLEVELGSTAHFVVTSDQEELVHVHGYDLFFDVAPGAETDIMFTADVPGIFEVELEGPHTLVLELEVR